MRYLWLSLLMLALPLLEADGGGQPPKPGRHLRLTYALCPATGTTCHLILTWTRPANYQSAKDTAKVAWSQVSPTALPSLRNRTTRGTADTLSITRPATGSPDRSGVVTLCYVRAGLSGQACNSPMAWTVPALPEAPVDTATNLQLSRIDVKPDAVTLAPGQTQQFCGLVKFANGAMALRDKERGYQTCLAEYAKLPASARVVSAQQQLIANAVCLTWSATGGTISGEACPGTQGWMRQYLPPLGLGGDTVDITIQPGRPVTAARTAS